MKQIERLISIKKDADIGKLYVFANRHRKEYETFLSLDMARAARRKFDQQKKWWTKVGIHDSYLWTSKSISSLKRDPESGYWYVQLPLEDDIIVSDLYPKKKIYEIKDFLDKNKWSKQSLNKLKTSGLEVTSKYYGILPTKKGYTIQDYMNKQYGLFDKLNDAVEYRDKLLREGVII